MVTVRLEKDGPAYTIYRTGSFQIRGAKTGELLTDAFEKFKSVLNEIGVNTSICEFSPATFVFMEDFEREIKLEALAIALGLEHTEYEPEQFPGLIYRPPEYEVTLLIFGSGKVIISGTTDRGQAEAAAAQLGEHISFISDI